MMSVADLAKKFNVGCAASHAEIPLVNKGAHSMPPGAIFATIFRHTACKQGGPLHAAQRDIRDTFIAILFLFLTNNYFLIPYCK